MPEKQKFNLALFHAFFNHKGGGEKFIFELRNRFNAHLFAGTINFKNYSEQNQDSFSKELFNPSYKLTYLQKDPQNTLLRLLKRFMAFCFSGKINELLVYDAVIFSGNVLFVQRRIKKKTGKNGGPKLIMFCHTPPRKLTDQFENFIKRAPFGLKTLFRISGKFILKQYIKDLKLMDLVITNSANTRKRLLDYTGINSIIIHPPVNTDRYKFISQGDYYLSYARLDSEKRIPLILDAFEKMPDKKLVICSTGPLRNWLEENIKKRKLSNVTYEGFVTDERLEELVGNCFAGVYIPVNEDFGMTQIEIMSAGKPVIGVNEGGLAETILDGKTGFLIKAGPSANELINAVKNLTPETGLLMKNACIQHVEKFSSLLFFSKIENELSKCLYLHK